MGLSHRIMWGELREMLSAKSPIDKAIEAAERVAREAGEVDDHQTLDVENAPPKRPAAKKPTAKKPTAKKPTAKKPTAKKPTAKKPATKRH